MEYDDLPQPAREEIVPHDQLHVDGENPNEQDEDTFSDLKRGMRDRGWVGGAIVANTGALPGYDGDPEGLICDGEHRWRAAEDLDIDAVPVKFIDFDDDAERRLWRQRLNKTTGEHDTKRDALEISAILDSGDYTEDLESVMSAAGEDIDDLLAELNDGPSAPPVYEYDVDHNVYFMDCVEGMQEHLDDDSVDLVFTSPPYNVEKSQAINSDRDVTEYSDDWDPGEFREFLSAVFAELERVIKPTGHIFVNFHNDYREGEVDTTGWVADLFDIPLRSHIVWYKGDCSSIPHLNRHGQFFPTWEPIYHLSPEQVPLPVTGQSDVWEHTPVSGYELEETEDHPAPFPVDLVSHAITTTTTPGDLVLDPFMGSGTTAVAAIQSDREYVGFELDEDGAYEPIVERRVADARRERDATAPDEGTDRDRDRDHDQEIDADADVDHDAATDD